MKLTNLVPLSAVVLIGCASTENPGVRYVDPNAVGAVAGTGVESQDINAAAAKAAQSIVSVSAIARAATPPTVVITPVANRSASPIDTTLYTTKLRGALMEHSAGKVRFLARDASWNANAAEQALRQSGQVAGGGTATTGRAGATYDYILTAELSGLSAASSAGQSEYFLIAFKLVDFQDLLVWESQYEIKKEGKVSAVYR
ncbi:MAG: penicillin-binding protein activator LpoB [Verrucomicrobiales bacterium]|nr:penicillin-binding protein activator LpoB [Verrucomicrobiales bacterium]